MRLMIDPGHGGKDPGAVGNGLQEKHLTLSISKRIRDILVVEYVGVEVFMTREDDRYISPGGRAKMANDKKVDFLLSVHINAGGGYGFESLRYTAASAKSIAYQDVIHPEIVAAIGVHDRGKKTKNVAVLRESKMPALLTENLFIDHPDDAARLKDAAFLDRIARGHVNGLAKAFGLKKRTATPQSKPSVIKRFRLYTGTFASIEDAERAAETLIKRHGWLIYIREEQGRYRLFTGTFDSYEAAQKAADMLRKLYGWLIYIREEPA